MMTHHDYYKQKFNAWYWQSDSKPKGRDRRSVKGMARTLFKKELQGLLSDLEHARELEIDLMLEEEANEASYCHYYGPCRTCRERRVKLDEA